MFAFCCNVGISGINDTLIIVTVEKHTATKKLVKVTGNTIIDKSGTRLKKVTIQTIL